jgi:hypothetical protein
MDLSGRLYKETDLRARRRVDLGMAVLMVVLLPSKLFGPDVWGERPLFVAAVLLATRCSYAGRSSRGPSCTPQPACMSGVEALRRPHRQRRFRDRRSAAVRTR